jgi:hypothetical protein
MKEAIHFWLALKIFPLRHIPDTLIKLTRVAGVSLLLFVPGCATQPKCILAPGAKIPGGESVVFGELTSNKKFPSGAFLSVMDSEHSIPVMQQTVQDLRTAFYWHLAPGQYAVFELGSKDDSFWTDELRQSTKRIYAEFRVPSAGEVIYVGRLDLDQNGDPIKLSVADDFDRALATLKANYPLVIGEPVKQLFKLENTR